MGTRRCERSSVIEVDGDAFGYSFGHADRSTTSSGGAVVVATGIVVLTDVSVDATVVVGASSVDGVGRAVLLLEQPATQSSPTTPATKARCIVSAPRQRAPS